MHKKVKKYTSIISLFSTMLIVLLAYIIFKYAPFGDKSFAVMDAQIQYLDFFSFLQNILCGKDSMFYSFNTAIGGSAIGIFGYYLASPINLLLKFINDKNVFLNIAILLKLSIASFTFSYFLKKRFYEKINPLINIVLSVSYSLMQYSIAQASNVMWLDGIYMLPLICWGIDKVIREKRIHFLSISIGLSIIFNWYTGGINCVFSAFYFIFELIIKNIEIKQKIKENLKTCVIYALAMFVGVLISGALFVPVVFSLMGGKGGTFDIAMIKNEFYGNIISTIANYHIGSVSTSQSLSIYCGAFPVIGFLCMITSKNISMKKKIISCLMLIVMITTCYYTPLFILFSLFKNSTSYYFRYSYVIIFTFIYISSFGFINIEKEQKVKVYKYLLYFSVLILILQLVSKSADIKYIYATIFFLMIDVCVLFKINKERKRLLNIFLVGLFFLETFLNIKVMFREGSSDILYKDYSVNQQKQIDEIKEYDNSNYRISQTMFRNYQNESELPAYYNDALAYNYMSISGYTSSPDNNALELLSNLGYRTEGECITIVNTSILPVDSLLGVKYILSNYQINGLEKIKEIGTYNGKDVYHNKYSLGMAFSTRDLQNVEENGNSFEYVNNLYSSILGEKVEVYKKAKYKMEDNVNIQTYTVENMGNNNDKYSLYAYFPWKNQYDGEIYSNGKCITQYAKWLSPKIVYIPIENADNTEIEIKAKEEIKTDEAQIYFVDLEKLEYATKKINENEIEQIDFSKNKININYNNEKSMKNLLITIPYTKGWILKINGEECQLNEYNKIMKIELLEGVNNIELTYKAPGYKLGIIASSIGIIILVFEFIYVRKRGQKVE